MKRNTHLRDKLQTKYNILDYKDPSKKEETKSTGMYVITLHLSKYPSDKIKKLPVELCKSILENE
jgi:hypothetical protein